MKITKDNFLYKIPEILESLLPGKVYELEWKQFREKRSRDANAYLWALIGKMADTLRTSKEELYFEALKRYGQSFLVKVRRPDLEKSLREFKYSEPYEQWYDPMGDTAYIKVYRGSSGYDTKEFSRLLDGVIDEAEDLGIDIDTEEVKELLKKWEPVWAERKSL